MKKTILPIVVLYKKDLRDADSINSLLDSDVNGYISEVFVYDNTPAGDLNGASIGGVYRDRNIIYLHDLNNSGVSAAYNSGMKKAKELDYKYVLLLDQDTIFPAGAIDFYFESIKGNPDINLHVPRLLTMKGEFCSPLRYAMHRGFVTGELSSGIYSLDKYSPINSGMLLDVETAISVGGYNNKVYLDFSDFQFIERLKGKSKEFFLMPLTLKQDLSNEDENQDNLLKRYAIYCECARMCQRLNIYDDFIYFMMVLVRATKLTIRTKNMKFLFVFYKKYVRGRK
ncbi:glycosyltransferase [Rahnella aquatilis]|uniref:glycosyltransferase n=1 Tax=Rahnella aquatilis TaxID=34038 RepID=UPI00364C837D